MLMFFSYYFEGVELGVCFNLILCVWEEEFCWCNGGFWMIFEVLIFVCILEEFFLLFKAAIALIFFSDKQKKKDKYFQNANCRISLPTFGCWTEGGLRNRFDWSSVEKRGMRNKGDSWFGMVNIRPLSYSSWAGLVQYLREKDDCDFVFGCD